MNAYRPPLSLLYLAYCLLPVSDESAGGAEQMLWTLEREMSARGHQTTVAACEDSRVSGRLFPTGRAPQKPDTFEQRQTEHDTRIVGEIWRRARAANAYDLVHDKSGSFWRNASAVSSPVLATLHLPRSFYRADLFAGLPPNLYFNCVSHAQACDFADLPRMLGVVPNGIAVERFPFHPAKSNYLLWLGRVCEEKGTHVAIEVAARTGMPLVLAGQVYPFTYHQKYYERYVRPHLGAAGSQVRFVEAPLFEQKVRLLRNARAVLIPSLCDETSSLVALEAMACGTPVIAFRRGGLPEIVADDETGNVVDTPEQMAAAVMRITDINPHACRTRVEQRHSAARMADDYELLYERLLNAHEAGGSRAA